MSSKLHTELELINDIASYSADPYGFVLYSFPWGIGELKDFNGPDAWQTKILTDIKNKTINYQQAIQMAIASGHGIGKSALVAWLILWALSTMEDTKGVVTANTESQLKTKTWAELAKWYRLFIAKHWFNFTATAIYSASKEHEKTWRIDMVAWSERNTEAFAGLHNQGKRILLIFDEASAIPDNIWEVSEGALTDEKTEIFWLVFGNPTRNTGKFFECFGKNRHRWTTEQIDSRTVKITNKEQIANWEKDYGEDSDFFRVRVRGVFPNTSNRQFIPTSFIEPARGKHIPEQAYNFAPRVIGVDPSWSGDDETVVFLRQGNMSKLLAVYKRIEDDFITAGYISKLEDEWKADAVFVDMGYGTGIISAGKQLGRRWILVPFGSESNNPGYLNKRAEMWGMMKDWLKEGGIIPDDPILCAELAGPEYFVRLNGKIQLEGKDDMKKRGLSSPNRADALALTFAQPVLNKNKSKAQEFSNTKKYDPLKF